MNRTCKSVTSSCNCNNLKVRLTTRGTYAKFLDRLMLLYFYSKLSLTAQAFNIINQDAIQSLKHVKCNLKRPCSITRLIKVQKRKIKIKRSTYRAKIGLPFYSGNFWRIQMNWICNMVCFCSIQ